MNPKKPNTQLNAAAQLFAAGEMLLLGFEVALPLPPATFLNLTRGDDSIIQVECTGSRNNNQFVVTENPDAEFYICVVTMTDSKPLYYIIPASEYKPVFDLYDVEPYKRDWGLLYGTQPDEKACEGVCGDEME